MSCKTLVEYRMSVRLRRPVLEGARHRGEKVGASV